MELTQEDIERIAKVVPGDVVVYLLDDEPRRLYASSSILSLTGYTADEYRAIAGHNAFDIVAPSDLPHIMDEIAHARETGADFSVSFRILSRDHGFAWIHGRGRTIGEMDGKPVVLATVINAGVETAPQQAVIESSDRPILIIDRTTYEILYMNSACENVFGRKPAIGQRCHDYKHGFDTPCPWCPIASMEGDSVELDDYRDSESGRWFQFDFKLIRWFDREAIVIYTFDVDDLKDEQTRLQGMVDREERLVGYVKTLSSPGSISSRIARVLEDIGTYLNADRTYLFGIDARGTTSITDEWCRPGVSPAIESFQNDTSGLADYWLRELEDGRNVIVSDVEQIRDVRPIEYAIMKAWDVRSYSESPLISDDVLLGFIGVDNPDADKLVHSADLLLSFAYYLSGAIVRARDEQALKDSKRRFELAIEGAELGVWEYDVREHTIVSPSNSFAKFGITGPIRDVPRSILPLLDEDEQERFLDFYARIDAGETKITDDFWVRWTPHSSRRCERVIYTVEKDDEGNPRIAYGIGMNYTAQKQEQEDFESFLKQMLAINPDTLCSYQLNLTRNTCDYVNGIPDYPIDLTQSVNIDAMMPKVTSHLADEGEVTRFLESMSRDKLIEKFKDGTTDVTESFRSAMPNGKIRWIDIHVNMITNPRTQDIIAAVSIADGDDAKVRSMILQHITETGYDHIAIIYPDESKVRIFYYSRVEPTGLTDQQKVATLDYQTALEAAKTWIHPESLELFEKNSALDSVVRHMALEGSISYEVDAIGTDGDTRRKLLTYLYLDDTHERILELQRDITASYREQQRMIALANEEANRVRDIIETISGGIAVLHMPDPDHLVFGYINQQLYRMLGFEPPAVSSRSDSARDDGDARDHGDARDDDGERTNGDAQRREDALATDDALVAAYLDDAFIGVHPDDLDRVKETFHNGFDSDHFVVEDYRTRGADGRYVWIREEVTLREITPDCRVFYALYQDMGEEVSLRERLQHQLEEEKTLRHQADAANEAKSNFLSNVSHDMRTPLNAVLGYTQLARSADDRESVRDYLAKVEQSGMVLKQLINDTLDLNRISTGKILLHPEPVGAYDIFGDLQTAIQPSADAKHITWVTDFSGAPMQTIEADTVRVREVFLNLLNNAVKFTPEGGMIALTVRRLSTEGDRAHDVITVSDTGCGMSPEFLAQAFEPFAQEHSKTIPDIEGSGLGLSIVKGLVELMGGKIEVASELGKGSTFSVYLDFKLVDDAPVDKRTPSETEWNLQGKKVLLVEDNPMNTEIARMLLEHEGMAVTCAEDGRQGLLAFSDSEPGTFDVILMDVRMPNMGGLDATQAIRALDRPDAKDVPIIAMTANAFERDVQECLDSGMNGHVAKPVDPKTLYQTIDACLNRRA